MCGQSTAYNTYATPPTPNPLFQGFSRYQNVLKEIISGRCVFTPQTLVWGVFYMNGGRTNVITNNQSGKIIKVVKAAINNAKICKKPIAGYDKEKKQAYVEYANGERKYV